MRAITRKLLPVVVAVLLVNCGLPSDEPVESDENAATSTEGAGGTSGNFDPRDGLTSVREVTKSAGLTRNDATADAIAYVSSISTRIGVDKPEFKVLSVTDKDPGDGLTHVRLQQMHEGVVVWGADCVVHLSGDAVL